MRKMRVTWEIDVEAETATQAAQRAWQAMHNPGSIANVFTVSVEGQKPVVIDLCEDPTNPV